MGLFSGADSSSRGDFISKNYAVLEVEGDQLASFPSFITYFHWRGLPIGIEWGTAPGFDPRSGGEEQNGSSRSGRMELRTTACRPAARSSSSASSARASKYIFGLSGGAAMPIFDALVDSPIQLILVRHEQGATHMADGYARSTGKPGVVLVTSGPRRHQHGHGPAHGADGLVADDRHLRPDDPARCSARTPSRRRTSPASRIRW